jgi:integrase
VDDIRAQRANGHGCNDSADFVELAGTLGLGQAELSGIRRQDIDLRTNKIQLFRRKSKQQFTIPIFPDARPIIERRLKNMEDSPAARLLPQDNCRKAMEGACRRLNFPHFEPRSLRRFHITRSLRAGIDAPTVGAWQGHKDGGKLVLKVYQAEVDDPHSQRMAAMLGGKPDNVVELRQEVGA